MIVFLADQKLKEAGQDLISLPSHPNPDKPDNKCGSIITKVKMKFSSIVLTIFALASTGLAATSCTPSFDYCSDVLINSKGKPKPSSPQMACS